MIGIDEVGRGAWAGPLLVVAARARQDLPNGLKDSKKLTRLQREALYTSIQQSCDIGEGWVSASEIDEHGLTAAMKLGVERALQALNADAGEAIVIDGHIDYCPSSYTQVQAVIDADATHPIVSAASIYAKVIRDGRMAQLALKYPDYGFEAHVGYGTARHKTAIIQLGIAPIHRKSYKPIQTLNNEQNKPSGRA